MQPAITRNYDKQKGVLPAEQVAWRAWDTFIQLAYLDQQAGIELAAAILELTESAARKYASRQNQRRKRYGRS